VLVVLPATLYAYERAEPLLRRAMRRRRHSAGRRALIGHGDQPLIGDRSRR